MATDLALILENRPEALADMGEALGAAGINMKRGCYSSCLGMDPLLARRHDLEHFIHDCSLPTDVVDGADIIGAIRGLSTMPCAH